MFFCSWFSNTLSLFLPVYMHVRLGGSGHVVSLDFALPVPFGSCDVHCRSPPPPSSWRCISGLSDFPPVSTSGSGLFGTSFWAARTAWLPGWFRLLPPSVLRRDVGGVVCGGAPYIRLPPCWASHTESVTTLLSWNMRHHDTLTLISHPTGIHSPSLSFHHLVSSIFQCSFLASFHTHSLPFCFLSSFSFPSCTSLFHLSLPPFCYIFALPSFIHFIFTKIPQFGVTIFSPHLCHFDFNGPLWALFVWVLLLYRAPSAPGGGVYDWSGIFMAAPPLRRCICIKYILDYIILIYCTILHIFL